MLLMTKVYALPDMDVIILNFFFQKCHLADWSKTIGKEEIKPGPRNMKFRIMKGTLVKARTVQLTDQERQQFGWL